MRSKKCMCIPYTGELGLRLEGTQSINYTVPVEGDLIITLSTDIQEEDKHRHILTPHYMTCDTHTCS